MRKRPLERSYDLGMKSRHHTTPVNHRAGNLISLLRRQSHAVSSLLLLLSAASPTLAANSHKDTCLLGGVNAPQKNHTHPERVGGNSAECR